MIITACYTATTATASATEFKNRQCASRPLFWPGTVCWVEASTQVKAPSGAGPTPRRPARARDRSTRPTRPPVPCHGPYRPLAMLSFLSPDQKPHDPVQRSEKRRSRSTRRGDPKKRFPEPAGPHARAQPQRESAPTPKAQTRHGARAESRWPCSAIAPVRKNRSAAVHTNFWVARERLDFLEHDAHFQRRFAPHAHAEAEPPKTRRSFTPTKTATASGVATRSCAPKTR